MSLEKGQVISNYEILGSLGAGAMGQVFRASDVRLKRDVAIKVLPEEWVRDEKRQSRFEQEAQTLASLNHQNIAQIYGIDTAGDTSFLVLELVPGETLAARIERGPLPVADAVDLCRQIAVGLQAAHDAGVIHRDLKPGNVQITPEGKAKILDFGLAKSMFPGVGDGDARATMTEAGAIIGTPSYMSPEQIRGRGIDRRTDIWAFGCVLFEALTGTRPFDGDTVPDVLAAIVERQPDLSKLPASTPDSIRDLLRRCLDKDPRTRLQDIGEARIVLERGLEESSVTSAPVGRPRPLVLLGSVIASAALTYFATTALAGQPAPPENPLENARPKALTNYKGTEYDVAISPDGTFVAFISNWEGGYDAYVGAVEGGPFVNLTKGTSSFLELPIREIGFDASSPPRVCILGGDKLFSMTVQGVDRKPLLGQESDWSPDGKRFAYHTVAEGDPISVANHDGTEDEEILRATPGVHQHFPIWSVDGRWIYFVRGTPALGDQQLWRVTPDGKVKEQITEGLREVAHPAPIDQRRVLFVAKDATGGGPWLYVVNVETRQHRRVTIGLTRYTSVAASDDGRRIVATVAHPTAKLCEVDFPRDEMILVLENPTPLQGTAGLRALSPSFGGEDLYFLSSQGTGDGLWCRRNGKNTELVPGEELALMHPPAISPDGKQVAIALNDGGRRRIHVMEKNGTKRKPLSKQIDARGAPAWVRDGSCVLTGGVDGVGREGLYEFHVAKGSVRPILHNQTATDPVCSPTQDLIIYFGKHVGPYRPMLAVRRNGQKVALPEIRDIQITRGAECARFLPDGRLVYMQNTGRSQELWLLSLESMKSRQLIRFATASAVKTFDISPDGKSIVFDWVEDNSDVVLFELGPEGDR